MTPMLSPALQWSPAATERLETWLARRCGEAELFGADPREVAEWRWVDPAEFAALRPVFASHRAFLREWWPQ